MPAKSEEACQVVTNDERMHAVSRATLGRWKTVSEMMEIFMDVDEESGDAIPLPTISSEILQLLLVWDTDCSYVRRDLELPTVENYGCRCFDLKGEVKAFFTEVKATQGQEMIIELIKAANYLQIPDLYRAACRFVAIEMKALKTTEKIKEYFGFPRADPLDAGLKTFRKNTKWCESL